MLKKETVLFLLCISLTCACQSPAEGKEEKNLSVVDCAVPGSETGLFFATVENSIPKPAVILQGMVWIPGGTFSMGTDAANESLCEIKGITNDA
ncbi:MAG: hypothetical protein GXC73_19790, partial [Chitinophagaceae bacterium]|nr:hypothetical protein [Chitinophagaceae bacterium]